MVRRERDWWGYDRWHQAEVFRYPVERRDFEHDLRRLIREYIVPGHGPVCTKDYIMKQSAFIREWMAAVAVGLAKGWSKEECVQRISFLDRFPMDVGQADLGPQVQRMNVERLYDFLLGKTERFS